MAAPVARAADDEASMRSVFAAGKRILRRRDQRHSVLQPRHVGIAASLAEDEAGIAPLRVEIAAAIQRFRRFDAGLFQLSGHCGP